MPPTFGLDSRSRCKSFGIRGYERIGRLVAGYGKALGMSVFICGNEASPVRTLSASLQVAGNHEDFWALRQPVAAPLNER